MRYVAKIHVLDVLDRVIVSGYYYDADEYSDPEHEVHEFTCDIQGRGEPVGYEWLRQALYTAFQDMAPPATRGV